MSGLIVAQHRLGDNRHSPREVVERLHLIWMEAMLVDRVDRAVAGGETGWSRLAAAVEAHLEAILDVSAFSRVVIRILPDDVPEVSADLTRLRDRYEDRFRALFGEVKLPEGMAPGLARLFLLGSLNWTPVWHRPGRTSISEIARQMLAPLRAAGGAS
jgi:TetR/AcrR family transcriptional regulator, cholesterol catabolism regulator